MAAEYLLSRGVDIEATMSSIQSESRSAVQHGSIECITDSKQSVVTRVVNARLAEGGSGSLWTLYLADGRIASVEKQMQSELNINHLPGVLDAKKKLCVPSCCHAHIHLDKCFILEDEKFDDLEIVKGDFDEAMKLTGEAKKRFEQDDLLRRGRRLMKESLDHGVTAMRAFVEVDEIVELKAVKAGIMLKEEFQDRCYIQICAFAQLALFTGEDGGYRRRQLLEAALNMNGVEVVGSTPYVEADRQRMIQNIEYTINQSLSHQKHLDFHLDYHLDTESEPSIWNVLDALKEHDWSGNAQVGRTICLGHCSRLTQLEEEEWNKLAQRIDELPIYFIGLPKSDLFMMGRPAESDGGGQRPRGTLQIPQMIKKYNLQGAIALNNVGNAFTPQCNVNPLDLVGFGVGMYQAATKNDLELLFECVSTRAMEAIGIRPGTTLLLQAEQPATVTFLASSNEQEKTSSIIGRHVLGSSQSLASPTLFNGRPV